MSLAPSLDQNNDISRKVDITREKLILAAERLFGELGIDAVPLKLIGAEAGQRNANSVQYHFGDRLGLLQAIFEYRERQIEPVRRRILDALVVDGVTDDVRGLLRACFEPYYRLYSERHEVSYLKVHAAYLQSHRPKGIPHPVDRVQDCTRSLHRTLALLRKRLHFLDRDRFAMRIEGVGAMFLNAAIQYDARDPARRPSLQVLLSDGIEMAACAMCALPSRSRVPTSQAGVRPDRA